jgi:hypothetical protein
LELAVERLSHGQSPLRIQRPPCPIHTPNTTPRPGHPISCILQHPPRETTRRVHRPHASSTYTAHQHRRWQCFPRTNTSTSAPAPSCMGSLASYTLQQLREVRPVKLDGGLGRAHTTPLAVVHVPAVLCVCTVSQRAQLRAAGRLVAMHQCSARLSWTPRETVGVAAKLTLHVGGWVTSKLLCMLEPSNTDASLLTLCATHPGTLRGSWWKRAVRVPPMNGCQHV